MPYLGANRPYPSQFQTQPAYGMEPTIPTGPGLIPQLQGQGGGLPSPPPGYFPTPGGGGPGFSLPDFAGIQAGGGVSIGADGSIQYNNPNQSGLYQSYIDALTNYGIAQGNDAGATERALIAAQSQNYGNQLGLQGQLGVAGLNLQGTLGTGLMDLEAALAATAANRYASELGLQGTQTQALASMYPHVLGQQRFNQAFPLLEGIIGGLQGGGGGVGGGFTLPGFGQSAPGPFEAALMQQIVSPMQTQQLLNNAFAQNAQNYAGDIRNAYAGFAGRGQNPQAAQGAQANAGATRAMADVNASRDIPLQSQQLNADTILRLIAERNQSRANDINAYTGTLSPILSSLASFV